MPAIDFIYFDAGGGHRSALNALREAIAEQRRPWEARPVNLQEVLDEMDPIRKLTGVRAQDVYNGIMVEDLHSSNTSLWTWKTGAAAWTRSTTGIDTTHRLYLLGQAATTTDPLYAAGGIYQTDWPEIYRSVDGGGHWTEVLGATGNVNVATGWAGTGGDRDWSYGGSACGFGVASGNGSELAYTDYGFVHVSDDGGASWRQAYLDSRDQNPSGSDIPKGKAYRSAGLENTSSWALAWGDSLDMFSGYTDIKGIRSTDAGISWGFGFSGDDDNSMYRIAKAPEREPTRGKLPDRADVPTLPHLHVRATTA